VRTSFQKKQITITSNKAGTASEDGLFQSVWCFSATGIPGHHTIKALKIIGLAFGHELALGSGV
jgi:hypothetical protein